MKQTILMVDDEPDAEMLFRQNFRQEIRKNVYKFLFARSGPEALDILSTQDPESIIVLLSDINMPAMTGIELLKATKETNPDMPVMMLTAYGDRETESRVLEIGALALMPKPIDFVRLKSALSSLANEVNA